MADFKVNLKERQMVMDNQLEDSEKILNERLKNLDAKAKKNEFLKWKVIFL